MNETQPVEPKKLRTQAERVIEKFGGARKLQAAMNRVAPDKFKHAEIIYKWNYPRSKGGTGGLIPTASLELVLRAARAEGITLTSDDLWPGPK